MIIKNGTIFCEDGIFRKQEIEMQNGIITALADTLNPQQDTDVIDASACYVVPGLVDIHIHGAMGADFSDGTPEAIETIARFLLQNGVTSFLGTTMALPEEELFTACETARPYFDKSIPGQATLRGINMEGPFFSQEKRGAQNPDFIIGANFDMFQRLQAASGGNIRTVAVAPEIEGGLGFIEQAAPLCTVSLAHTATDFDTASQAFALGADHLTHLFNGMPPLHHREPGVIGAAVDAEAYAELICDGLHLHPAVVRASFRLFGDDRICLISDSMRACGLADGQYVLGGQTMTVTNGGSFTENGSLAGSVTNLLGCMRRTVNLGIPLERALKAATINPAKSVGLDDKIGSLTIGKRGDVLVLNQDLELKHVLSGGVLAF
ncbi:MAG: N-acetylglucosamine-6-phosphate deacetylase [Oscillospiraceae bacterium]|nr:N-acetylglucosamine-6-phosphate deacetylase [Oscillospiraceae bacterium]